MKKFALALGVMTLATLTSLLSLPVMASSAACQVNTKKELSLDEKHFDQSLQAGWRVLARQPKCREAAADLIEAYRKAHHSKSITLAWHEAQMRAMVGQNDKAVALFKQAKHPKADPFGWNLYVDATVAFLQNNKPQLLKDRKEMMALPRPKGYLPAGKVAKDSDLKWPLYIDKVDAFVSCFGSSYQHAYSECSAPKS
ncbi:hypothetical protein [Gallaecimonas mangrovi]|uniref:hypothetical protein n=1 Tax=Gallaecimonas mangrovi TaxID=2291597 RepID=UPI000E204961|nr:hypothetical protein [Gallaecimonas mangrovi]